MIPKTILERLSWSHWSVACPIIGLAVAFLAVVFTVSIWVDESAYWLTISVLFYGWFPLILSLGIVSGLVGAKRDAPAKALGRTGTAVNALLLVVLVFLLSPRAQALGLSALAHTGQSRAQYELGKRYLFGDGVREDDERGLELLTLAAEAGFQRAQYDLASIYYGSYADVRLVAEMRDDQAAVKWFALCAEGDQDRGLAYNAKLRLSWIREGQNKALHPNPDPPRN